MNGRGLLKLVQPAFNQAFAPPPPWTPTNAPMPATPPTVWAPDGTPMLVDPPMQALAGLVRDQRRNDRPWVDPMPHAQARARTARLVRDEISTVTLVAGIIAGLAVLGPRIFPRR